MDYIYTFLWSMTPFGELRLSIPMGMNTYELPWYTTLPIAFAGNLIPAVFWLLVLPKIGTFLINTPGPIGRLLSWRVRTLKNSNSHRVQKFGPIALVTLVAIPLPLTGVWTASLTAWALDIPLRTALVPIAVGTLIAAFIVTALTAVGLELAKM